MVTTLQFSHMFVAIREEKASKKMSLVNRIVYILPGANKGGGMVSRHITLAQ